MKFIYQYLLIVISITFFEACQEKSSKLTIDEINWTIIIPNDYKLNTEDNIPKLSRKYFQIEKDKKNMITFKIEPFDAINKSMEEITKDRHKLFELLRANREPQEQEYSYSTIKFNEDEFEQYQRIVRKSNLEFESCTLNYTSVISGYYVQIEVDYNNSKDGNELLAILKSTQ